MKLVEILRYLHKTEGVPASRMNRIKEYLEIRKERKTIRNVLRLIAAESDCQNTSIWNLRFKAAITCRKIDSPKKWIILFLKTEGLTITEYKGIPSDDGESSNETIISWEKK